MKKLCSLIAISGLILILTRCGKGPTANIPCNPSHVGNNLSVSVTKISGNSYKIQLCNDLNSSQTYTIFGGDQTSIQPGNISTAAQWRKAHLSNAATTGIVVQVDFQSSDTYFVFYLDDVNGNFDTTTNLVSGQLPSR